MNSFANPIDCGNELVFAETSYRRIPPSLYGAKFTYPELGSWFYRQISMTEQISPPVYMYKLSDVILIDSSFIYDLNEDDFLGFSCLDANLPALRGRIEAAKYPPPSLEYYLLDQCQNYDRSDPIVHFTKAGYSNYGHFLVEMLPKLLVFREYGMSKINLLIPQCAAKFEWLVKAIGSSIGLEINLCNTGADSMYSCKNLFACSPVSRHPAQKNPILKSVANSLRQHLSLETATAGYQPSKRIFINRGANEKRRFVNDEEIRRIHSDRGFQEFVPSLDKMSASVGLFASADVISGGLGAGLSNLIFSQAGSTALLIYPGYHDLFFWDLACLFGLNTLWMFSASIDDWNENIDNLDYDVDSNLLSAIVDLL
jgi:hypothetical protein